MLQIASGKLFSGPPARQNELRGVLFSNLMILGRDTIETAAGRILPTNTGPDGHGQMVYELTEFMEQAPGAGVLASHGIGPYLHDFAAIVTLGMNVTCTVSPQETIRLVGQKSSTKVGYSPSEFIPCVFDERVVCRDQDIADFVGFVSELIGLERKSYIAAMRAIRTYVVALHRLADDLDLSYTLLVASIESLAQSFDGFNATWADYDQRKRAAIDKALLDANEEIGYRVREALLKTERTSLARRFREFAKAHIGGSFYRTEAENVEGPQSRADLDQGLRKAYDIRSGYIHRAQELPRILAIGRVPGETVRLEETTQLTLCGLARVARHVITEFVRKQPKVEKEEYDYSREQHGVVSLPLAEEYWIGNTSDLEASSGAKRLEGFLNQLASFYSNNEGAKLSDLRPMLAEVERHMRSWTEKVRRPFLALYLLFNGSMSPEQRTAGVEGVQERFGHETDVPCIENLVAHLILGIRPDWTDSEWRGVFDRYIAERGRKKRLLLPRAFEAGIALELAERYRVAGNMASAREMLSCATEYHPGHKPLRDIEEGFDAERPINWFECVFPNAPNREGRTPSA